MQNPWGEPTDEFDLAQIEQAGELIALTISGPETYYDYKGSKMGAHAMLCQQFADSLGVRLRIELCRDTTEMFDRLDDGDGDLIAYPLNMPDELSPGWKVSDEKPDLAEALRVWYHSGRMSLVRAEEQRLLNSGGNIRRKVYAPMQNSAKGIISPYDALFRQYGQKIRWDWRLLAAQCYQESTFDPDATSWAGARGLMQIMPQTADHLGMARSELSNPAQNIAAATRYLVELEQAFSDIPSRRERQDFVLAAYNGGAHHIRDAMALTGQNGRDPHRWREVAQYVLRLREPQYYQNPVVRYGYMRGNETVEYVELIRQRYKQYSGVKSSANISTPQKSRNERHRKKYQIEMPE
jgi:membrane-bound lytic murein transglycosylase F